MSARQVARECLDADPARALPPAPRAPRWPVVAVLAALGLAILGGVVIPQWTADQEHAQLQAIDAHLRAIEERADLRARQAMSRTVRAAYEQGLREGLRERGCGNRTLRAGL
jgi:hypothetical protein